MLCTESLLVGRNPRLDQFQVHPNGKSRLRDQEADPMRNRTCCTLLGMLVIAGGLSGLGTQAIASSFTACVSQGTVTCVLGPSPASGTFSNNTTGTGSSSASASATGGILGGSALATSTGTSSASNTNSAIFGAKAIIDDLIITGPDSEASIQVTVDLDGLMNLSGLNGTDAFGSVTAKLKISQPLGAASPLAQFSFSSGAQLDTVINTTLTTSAVTLPTNTNLMVEMFLEGTVVASDNFGPGSASATVDFLNSMSFPTSGPVFTLPEGFTANSTDGNIVDNLFVGVTIPGDIDGDGIANLDDHLIFTDCMNGPDVAVPPVGCAPDEFDLADMEVDTDVDLADFGELQIAFPE